MKITYTKYVFVLLSLMLWNISVQAQPPVKPLTKQMETHEEKNHPSQAEPKHTTDEHIHALSLDDLMKGNENFRNEVRKNQNFVDQREMLSTGQAPNFIVVTCSDSRVSPELIFDSGLGEVFVIRTAGNVIDSVGLGSIEYSAEHLHSKYLLVLGHTSCGAVTAAVQGETESPYINSIIHYIYPAVKTAKSKSKDKNDIINIAIEENIKNQIKFIRKSEIIKHLEHNGELTIIPCIYDIKTGAVNIIK